MKTIRELGSDFKRKGVALYSCGCCCCCSCLHSLGAGFLFGRAAVRAEAISQGKGRASGLGGLAVGAMLFPVVFIAGAALVAPSTDMKGIMLALVGFAPIVLPIIALASWLMGALAVMIQSTSDSPEVHSARMDALGKIGSEFSKATAMSLLLTIPLFLATCALGVTGLNFGLFK